MLGALLAVGATAVRRSRSAVTSRAAAAAGGNVSQCAQLKGDAARACYSREVGARARRRSAARTPRAVFAADTGGAVTFTADDRRHERRAAVRPAPARRRHRREQAVLDRLGRAAVMTRSRIILFAALAVLVLAGGVVAGVMATGGDDDGAVPAPPQTATPAADRAGRDRGPQHLRRPGPRRGPRLLLPRARGDRQRRRRPARRRRGHHRGRLRRPVRLPARQLPRDHAHGRARVRPAHPPHARRS